MYKCKHGRVEAIGLKPLLRTDAHIPLCEGGVSFFVRGSRFRHEVYERSLLDFPQRPGHKVVPVSFRYGLLSLRASGVIIDFYSNRAIPDLCLES